MFKKIKKESYNPGFTLIEIMIVVAIIALITSISIPSIVRQHRKSQASVILKDLEIIEKSMDLFALEHGKNTDYPITFSEIKPYVKPRTNFFSQGKDMLGNYYILSDLGTPPRLDQATHDLLDNYVTEKFWGRFSIEP